MTALPAASEGSVVRLPDGRRLGYAEFGAERGWPVLYFHGFPSSRLEARLAHVPATRCGARVLALDRPGLGLSDFQPGRTIPDWPADVAAFADALGLDRFSVLGVSGGAPYALACAARLGARLRSVAVVGPLAPLDLPRDADGGVLPVRFGLTVARRARWLVAPLVHSVAWAMRHHAARIYREMERSVTAPDRRVLARAEVRDALLGAFQESLRQGTRGATHELGLYGSDWGFPFTAVEAEVMLWHGEADAVVPVAMGRALARVLPNCQARFLDGEGHYSLPLLHCEDILAALASSAVTSRSRR
jgi:pimeloyl-ACP methyl ester carboxylesterase